LKPIVHLAACILAAPSWAADAADPNAPVPAPQYRSVFQDTPSGVEDAAKDWRKANAEVAQFPRGHADILKWEKAHPGPGSRSAPAPEKPPTAPAANHKH
jgi:hypothetical protein